MGRTRIITPEQILDAAEEVVARDGAARLTLDAVAMQAGVSKASVLYNHPSKQALITAVVQRAIALDNAFHAQVTEALGSVDSACIRGRIAAAAAPPTAESRAVALNLCAALAQDAELRTAIQHNQKVTVQRVLSESNRPRGALLAYLALEGLKLLECLDFHTWPDAARREILSEIESLVDAGPASDEAAIAEASIHSKAVPARPQRRRASTRASALAAKDIQTQARPSRKRAPSPR